MKYYRTAKIFLIDLKKENCFIYICHTITRVRVLNIHLCQHFMSILGNGWYLDKIVIRESPKAQDKVVFPCSRYERTCKYKLEYLLFYTDVINVLL